MSYPSLPEPKNTSRSKRAISWGAVLMVLALIVFLNQKIAHADLFSFMQSLLTGGTASAQVPSIGSTSDSETSDILQAAANLNPTSTLEVPPIQGDVLVPDIAASNDGAEEDQTNTQISTYIVRPGDNISTVAQMFDVSINTVLWANSLTSHSVLQPGQTLIILPISGINYTIQKGDTVQGIAKKYNADPNDILTYNDLSSGAALVAGTSILIPDGELAAPTSSSGSGHGKTSTAPYEPIIGNVSNLPSYNGYYSCPLVGRLTQGLHGHNAVDLAAPLHTTIHAAAAGEVIISISNGAWNGGYGNFVVISHNNGTETLYAHMSKTAVTVGQEVDSGDPIGYVGMTGLTTGPHVHFEVRGAKNPFATVSCD